MKDIATIKLPRIQCGDEYMTELEFWQLDETKEMHPRDVVVARVNAATPTSKEADSEYEGQHLIILRSIGIDGCTIVKSLMRISVGAAVDDPTRKRFALDLLKYMKDAPLGVLYDNGLRSR